jgi:hypothetical protein
VERGQAWDKFNFLSFNAGIVGGMAFPIIHMKLVCGMEVTSRHSANLAGYKLAVENFRSEMQLESVIHSSSTGFIFTLPLSFTH